MTQRSVIIPRRREIWWISFDPSICGEVKKTRPAVIVSNDIANKALNRVQVIPLTSTIRNIYPAECLITVQGKQSKAMADQLTTISKLRLSKKIGTLNAHEMDEIERIIRLQLGM
jgi:mRNA interferase MazF